MYTRKESLTLVSVFALYGMSIFSIKCITSCHSSALTSEEEFGFKSAGQFVAKCLLFSVFQNKYADEKCNNSEKKPFLVDIWHLT